MISDLEAAHILIALSRSKPRDVVKKPTEKEEDSLSLQFPRQKRSSSRRKIRRSFPMDPCSSTALVAYVSQEDASPPRVPPLIRKKRPRASSSTSQEDESPPTMPSLSRKKRPRASSSSEIVEDVSQEDESPPTVLPFKKRPRASSSTALVAYASQEDESPPAMPSLSRKKRSRASSSTAMVEDVSQEDESPPTRPSLSRKKRSRASSSSTAIVEYASQADESPETPPLSRKKRPKQPKKKAKAAASSWTTEATPEWLLTLVKGEETKKIIEKELSATDVSRGHNRLSLPCSHIIDLDFLSPAEQGVIEQDEGQKHKNGVNAKLVVKFVDSDVLKVFEVNVRRWRMPKKTGSHTFVYNLVTGWNKVVDGCDLGEYDKIRLWSFHSDGRLCFALGLATPFPPSPPLLLPPPPPTSDSEDDEPEEMSSALVIYDESNDDLQPK